MKLDDRHASAQRQAARHVAAPPATRIVVLGVLLLVALLLALACSALAVLTSSPASAAPSSPYCGGNHGPRLTLPATVTPKPTNHGPGRPSIPPTPTPR